MFTLSMILSCIACLLAGFFVAVMDRTENEVSFNQSVFKGLTPKFWCKEVSWKYVSFLPMTKYRPDAWHLAKTFSIGCYAIGFGIPWDGWNIVIAIAIKVAIAVLSFNIFYNKILRRKV